MKIGRYGRYSRDTSVLVTLAVFGALLGLMASTTAVAGDVYWSVGVSIPGVQVGVSAPQRVYVPVQVPVYVPAQPYYGQPQPIYTQPQVIYSPPQVIYTQPQVIYTQPRPVYVQPQPVVIYNGWQHPKRHHHQDRYQVVPRPVQYVTPAVQPRHSGQPRAYPSGYEYDYSIRQDRG